MKKEHIEKIEECLMRPPSYQDFSWGPSYSFEETRQREALAAFREFIKKAPKSLFTKKTSKTKKKTQNQ